MAPEVLTGIFTGVGALIAFLGTSLTALVTNRAQREQRREAQLERVMDARREAYTSALAASATFMALAQVVSDQINENLALDGVHSSYNECNASWRKVVEAVSRVEVIGPDEVGTNALKFRQSMDRYRDNLDLRYATYVADQNAEALHRLEDNFFEAYRNYRDKRITFVALARKYSTAATM